MSFPTTFPLSVPVSIDRLQVLWKTLAYTYFSGRLPPIRIEWSSRLTASTGLFVSHIGPRSRHVSCEEQHEPARLIRLSAPLLYNQPKTEIVRTLAHEMIHQWQYDVKKSRPTHGPEFLKFMARMNRDGLGITIRHSLNQQVEAFTKYAWQCTKCGESYRRQRRSISPHRHRCGSCYGRLREVSLGVTDQVKGPLTPSKLEHWLRGGRKTTSKQQNHPQQLVLDFVKENGEKENY